jgi:hypothetical protein
LVAVAWQATGQEHLLAALFNPSCLADRAVAEELAFIQVNAIALFPIDVLEVLAELPISSRITALVRLFDSSAGVLDEGASRELRGALKPFADDCSDPRNFDARLVLAFLENRAEVALN